MTKLSECLNIMIICVSLYLAIISKVILSTVFENWLYEIEILPFVLFFLFAAYSAFIVVYRTLNVNDCPQAAEELQKQIIEAKADLKSKGFEFID